MGRVCDGALGGRPVWANYACNRKRSLTTEPSVVGLCRQTADKSVEDTLEMITNDVCGRDYNGEVSGETIYCTAPLYYMKQKANLYYRN